MFTEEWFGQASQNTLASLVGAVESTPGLLVEIGAWEGRSSCAMANAAHPRTVHSVDTWQGSGHEISEKLAAERDIFASWSANVAEYTKGNVVPHRMGWREYLPTVTEPIALAFVDAEHSYTEVRDNIAALLPLMAPGGIICGDDVHHPPVQEAVTEMLGDLVFMEATLWIWRMPIDPHDYDLALLRGAHPDLVPLTDVFIEAIRTVEPIWRDYVTTVSALDHAASPATLAMLHHVAATRKPARVLDLGSGLSTAVLASVCDSVTSMDTDEAWMARTAEFLQRHNLEAALLMAVEPEGEFDLIFHDLAGGAVREAWSDTAARHLAPGGIIIYDDAHCDSHRQSFVDAATDHGLSLYSLRTRTVDAIERWSMIAIKEGAQ